MPLPWITMWRIERPALVTILNYGLPDRSVCSLMR
jgi:hypothetical protein